MIVASLSPRRNPLPFLGAAIAVLALCAVAGRAGHEQAAGTADPPAATIAARSLEVQERTDGLTVRLAANGALVQHLPIGTDSFVRGVFHSLTLLRQAHGVPDTVPYQLAELSDGRVLLSDPATATRIDLEGFGPSNRAAFLRLLGLTVVGLKT